MKTNDVIRKIFLFKPLRAFYICFFSGIIAMGISLLTSWLISWYISNSADINIKPSIYIDFAYSYIPLFILIISTAFFAIYAFRDMTRREIIISCIIPIVYSIIINYLPAYIPIHSDVHVWLSAPAAMTHFTVFLLVFQAGFDVPFIFMGFNSMAFIFLFARKKNKQPQNTDMLP